MPRRPPRFAGFSYTGRHRYFLTMCTGSRAQYFTSRTSVELVKLQLVRSSRDFEIAIPAYCFMPHHLHFLAEGKRATSDLQGFCRAFRQRSGFAWRRTRRSWLWQEGYHDRVLRETETTFSVVRYMLDNPVRAGLVDRPERYPHWGSLIWTREEVVEFVQLGNPLG